MASIRAFSTAGRMAKHANASQRVKGGLVALQRPRSLVQLPAVHQVQLPATHQVHGRGSNSFSTRAASNEAAGPSAQQNWEIAMLHDGDCPLCEREVNFLRGRDAGRGKIKFVDISAPDYSAEANAGISYVEAMNRIHGILPDGSVVTDVEVFRRLYEAVGLGWVYAITRVEPIGKAANALYGVWAKYRLQVTGRPGLEVVLEQRAKKMCATPAAAEGQQ